MAVLRHVLRHGGDNAHRGHHHGGVNMATVKCAEELAADRLM